jgi:hypothetical protein
MEVTGMSMCNMHLDFNDDVDFDFSSLPAGCPSGSISGSSYASSSLGPHTPTSGRSTPPFSTSFDFGSSFASSVDSVPFDIATPSSATSTYFPMTPEAAPVSDYAYPVFPVTPSRGQLGFPGHPLSGCGTQLTPSQSMHCNFLANQFGAPPSLSTAPSVMTQFEHLSVPDMASHWAYPDSPISFNQQPAPRLVDSAQSIKQEFVQLVKQEFEDDSMPLSTTTPSSSARKLALMGQARHRTTALQHAQQCPPRSKVRTTRVQRVRKPCAARVTDDNDGNDNRDSDNDDEDDGFDFTVDSVEPKSTFKCPVEGCKAKPYHRNEHMKRHMKTYVFYSTSSHSHPLN